MSAPSLPPRLHFHDEKLDKVSPKKRRKKWSQQPPEKSRKQSRKTWSKRLRYALQRNYEQYTMWDVDWQQEQESRCQWLTRWEENKVEQWEKWWNYNREKQCEKQLKEVLKKWEWLKTTSRNEAREEWEDEQRRYKEKVEPEYRRQWEAQREHQLKKQPSWLRLFDEWNERKKYVLEKQLKGQWEQEKKNIIERWQEQRQNQQWKKLKQEILEKMREEQQKRPQVQLWEKQLEEEWQKHSEARDKQEEMLQKALRGKHLFIPYNKHLIHRKKQGWDHQMIYLWENYWREQNHESELEVLEGLWKILWENVWEYKFQRLQILWNISDWFDDRWKMTAKASPCWELQRWKKFKKQWGVESQQEEEYLQRLISRFQAELRKQCENWAGQYRCYLQCEEVWLQEIRRLEQGIEKKQESRLKKQQHVERQRMNLEAAALQERWRRKEKENLWFQEWQHRVQARQTQLRSQKFKELKGEQEIITERILKKKKEEGEEKENALGLPPIRSYPRLPRNHKRRSRPLFQLVALLFPATTILATKRRINRPTFQASPPQKLSDAKFMVLEGFLDISQYTYRFIILHRRILWLQMLLRCIRSSTHYLNKPFKSYSNILISRWLSHTAIPLCRALLGPVKPPICSLRPVSTSLPAYIYKRLGHSSTTIRILHLNPGSGTDPIKCYLEHVSLDSNPKYNALSYVWGAPKGTIPILCGENSTLKVTENLFSALCHIRHRCRPRTFWIDALCIDQTSDDEKNHQVSLMFNIYKAASRVILWFGLCTTTNAFKEVADIYMFSASLTPFRSPAHIIWSLLENPYWTRVWVVQEVFAGRSSGFALLEPIVLFGCWSIPLSTILKIADIVYGYPIKSIPRDWYNDHDRHIARRFQHIARFASSLNDTTWVYNSNVFQVLECSLQLNATDPRDLLFAVSSITGFIFIRVDYNLSAAEVAMDLFYELHNSKQFHTLLSHVWIERLPHNYPSWCHPRLFRQPQIPLAMAKLLSLSESTERSIDFKRDALAGKLHIHLGIFDVVEEITASPLNLQHDETVSMLNNWYSFNSLTMFTFRKVLEFIEAQAGRDFSETGVLLPCSYIANQPEQGEVYEDFLLKRNIWRQSVTQEMKDLCFYRTRNNCFGIASSLLQPGDVIAGRDRHAFLSLRPVKSGNEGEHVYHMIGRTTCKLTIEMQLSRSVFPISMTII